MLTNFTEWSIKLSEIAKLQGFEVEVIINEDYFTKISIDSDVYVSEIVIWNNHNLCEAGIMDVSSEKYLYQVSCEYDEKYPFSDYFSEFLAILELTTGTIKIE